MTTPLHLEMPADVDQLAGARADVRRWLADEGLDEATARDLLSVASEFLLHAIVRAGGAGSVHLLGERRPDGVRLAVRTTPAAADAPRPLRLPPDPLADGALGRRMVEQCCDEVQISLDGAVASAECWRGVA